MFIYIYINNFYMKITINDLKNLSKFSLASGNAIIPLF